ncbi:hypothetical protein NMG60_11002017 [Bertholletia excelsa]
MGGLVGKLESPEACIPQTKFEAQMVEAMKRRESKGTSIKAFNSVILKFPKIDASFRKCKNIFDEFDEDSNGSIDPEELKHCFKKLEINFSEEEINGLFEGCDINNHMGIEFNEFIVLLCIVYLLKDKFRIGMPNLESTFETLVDAFVFLDKNKDGYVSRSEMIQAINETGTGEQSSGALAMKRFEEMDWDKNGTVSFKEFLFAFTRWVGIDEVDDEDGEEECA